MLTGSARINPDWSAGFRFVIEFTGGATGIAVNQNDDDGGTDGDGVLDVREVHWWLKHERLGRIAVGRNQPATDNIILIDLGGTGAANSIFNYWGFWLRDSGTPDQAGQLSATIGNFYSGLDTARADGVMYYSPTYMGFNLQAFWGEDDFWDVAIRFSNEWNGLRVAFGVGYFQNLDEEADVARATLDDGNRDLTGWKGSGSVWHVPTGLFVTGAFVHNEYGGSQAASLNAACPNAVAGSNAATLQAQGFTCANRPNEDYWKLIAGIRKNFFGIGHTSLYGEYSEVTGKLEGRNFQTLTAGAAGNDIDFVTSSKATFWGVGVVQRISAAAMELFLGYRNYSFDISGQDEGTNTIVTAPLEDFSSVIAGGRIKF